MEIVGRHFRPEFINRIDETVVFHPLGREQIRSITNIQVGYMRKRLRERHMDIEFTEAALDKIGEAGFDPVYGARPLKRAIQHRVENPLAQKILAGEFEEKDVILVDASGEDIVFSKKPGAKATAA
jgi:ATP-dependent Clp protease ATP-binding subunit ClpB